MVGESRGEEKEERREEKRREGKGSIKIESKQLFMRRFTRVGRESY
jgi:hypothetical protein